MSNVVHSLGPLPPPEFAWQIGKTIASIDFVNAVTKFIQENPSHPNVENLKKLVQQVMEGTLIFKQPVSLEPYLKELPRGGLPPVEDK